MTDTQTDGHSLLQLRIDNTEQEQEQDKRHTKTGFINIDMLISQLLNDLFLKKHLINKSYSGMS